MKKQYDRISNEIWAIDGVKGHGLFVGRAAAAVVADPGSADKAVVTELLPTAAA